MHHELMHENELEYYSDPLGLLTFLTSYSLLNKMSLSTRRPVFGRIICFSWIFTCIL